MNHEHRSHWAGPSAAHSGLRPLGWAAAAFATLMILYFGVLTLVSGWTFTFRQFGQTWYYVLALGAGFAIQVGLYVRLRQVLAGTGATRGMIAASGTTSAAAMVSCCAHYLVNVAPVLGAAGLVTFATQYQVQFFWVGLAFNAAGVAYIGKKLFNALTEHAQCATA